jgi:hypothetical protein
MAIITIPTSAGGVSIPGALIDGPLGALFGKKYSLPYFQYPRDLESATRGHAIQFTIQEVEPLTYQQTKNFVTGKASEISNSVSNAISNPGEALSGAQSSLSGAWDKAVEGVQKFGENPSTGSFTTNNLTFAQPKTKNVGVISLYIPDTVNFQYGASYTDPSLLEVAGSVPLVGGVVQNVTSAVTSDAAKLLMRTAGYAVNPQQQLLFQGISFRTYQMAFTFTPYSKAESDSVVEIIKMFKKHAMPKMVTDAAGMFFTTPSMFDVKFLYNGKENTKINKIARSVIESIDVNYAPNGWSAHTDGAPIQTTLTINFKEMVLVDRALVDKGY